MYNQPDFAALASTTKKSQVDYEKGNTFPNAAYLAAIANAGADVQYIITGRYAHDVQVEEGYAVRESRPSYGHDLARRDGDHYATIPLYDVHAAAGMGVVVGHEQSTEVVHFRQDWLRMELGVNASDLRLIFVYGDSMAPTLTPGDMILVDTRDDKVERDGIYVLRLDGALLVKRLQRLPGSILRVVSDNVGYQPYQIKLAEVEGTDIAVIGRVVWQGRRV